MICSAELFRKKIGRKVFRKPKVQNKIISTDTHFLFCL